MAQLVFCWRHIEKEHNRQWDSLGQIKKPKQTHVIFQDFKGPYTVADYCMCLNSESMQLTQFF